MENQNGTVDRMVEQLDRPPDGSTVGPTARDSRTASALLRDGRPRGTTPPSTLSGRTGVGIAGRLPVGVRLSDVLSMLASTAQTGELQVVSETVEGRVWLERGELADAQVGARPPWARPSSSWPASPTAGSPSPPAPSSTLVQRASRDSVPVMTVLAEVGPQVDEWGSIRELVPLEALVTLSPSPRARTSGSATTSGGFSPRSGPVATR